MNLDLLVNEAMSVANASLSYYFDTMMYERFKRNYTSEIIQYCETYGRDESVDRSTRDFINRIKKTIEEKGIDQFDCRSHLDISALNHLILYSTFRRIFEEPFANPDQLTTLNAKPIVLPKECKTPFSFAVYSIVEARNKIKHRNESKVGSRDLREELSDLEKVLDVIEAVDVFLKPFHTSKWSNGLAGRKSYLDEIEGLLNQLKETVLDGDEKTENVIMHFNVLNSLGSVRIRLKDEDNGLVAANWKLNKEDIEFRLPFGRFILEAYNEDDMKARYKVSPNAISVLGTGKSFRLEFSIEKEKSQKDRLVDAFRQLATKGKDSESIDALSALDKGNYQVATPFLSFLYKFGIWVEKNPSMALDYKMNADVLFLDADEAKIPAYEAKEKEDYLFAAIMFINYSILSDDGEGYFNAGICLYKASVGYELCVRCLELAKEFKYIPDNANDRIDLLLRGLNSKEGKRKFGIL